jgi:hypothetical protein
MQFAPLNGDDDMIALGLALQKSTTVSRFIFRATKMKTVEGCSTIVEYMRTTKNLQELTIHGPNTNESSSPRKRRLMAEATDRILLALRENTYLQKLELLPADLSGHTLSHYLKAPNISLQVLRLKYYCGYFLYSDSDASNVAEAIQQCRTLKHVQLGRLPTSLMVAILQCVIWNHPSVQKLSMYQLASQNWHADVLGALQNHSYSSSNSQLRSLEFILCHHLPDEVLQPIMAMIQQHPSVESLQFERCTISHHDAFQNLLREAMKAPTLITLDLSCCYLRNSAFGTLESWSLPWYHDKMSTLRTLHLIGEHLDEEGMHQLLLFL